MTAHSESRRLFETSRSVIPGGVNSPVRACGSVGADPLFVARGEGCILTDADGNHYVDYVCSWGPLILGHTHAEVMDAITEAIAAGTTFGAPTESELQFAQVVCEAVPSIDRVRAVSSGTEATMSALRLARGFTERSKIIKIDGGYHGHADFLLVAAGSGAATLGIPGSAGVPEGATKDTLLVPFNDAGAVRAVFEAHSDEIAAVIVEPIPGNMGVVPPTDGYLQALREITAERSAVLIFDEVISGFRASYGGAQQLYGVTPDLTCLGKIIGGGLPAAAFGGRADIMAKLAPDGPVYQAGTLSGNPLAMTAGLKTLEILRRPGAYQRLEDLGAALEAGLRRAVDATGVRACVNRVGSLLTLFFCDGPVTDYDGAKAANAEQFGAFFRAMRERGIFLPPSQFEAWFVSLAHGEREIAETVAKAEESLKLISG